MSFEKSYLLLLILPVIYIAYLYIMKRQTFDGYLLSIKNKQTSSIDFRFFLLLLSIVFLLIASSYPKSEMSRMPLEEKGHAFIFCIDISSSMKALDFSPKNRLDIAKEVVTDFINFRKTDYFGIILFAKHSYPFIPLTFDNDFVLKKIYEISIGMLDDGTAIGNALVSAIDQLKNYEGESRSVILITDGINNSGYISPILAAEYAKKYKIQIYPIAIGTDKEIPFPFKDSKGLFYTKKIKIPVDYVILRSIAKISGTDDYFLADNKESLLKIMSKINILRPIVFNVKTFIYYKKHFKLFLLLGYISLILFELLYFLTVKLEY